METIPTRLSKSGFNASIYSNGEKLSVYKIEHSKTAWGGEKVEGYIESTAGSRFEVEMENSWRRKSKAPCVVGRILLDGTGMKQVFVSRLILGSLTPCYGLRGQDQAGITLARTRPVTVEGRTDYLIALWFFIILTIRMVFSNTRGNKPQKTSSFSVCKHLT
jgi:hypothetical protein